MIPSFSPRSAPLELSGASRISVLVRCNDRRLASMPFSCSRDQLPGNAQSYLTKAFEIALRLAFSFRRSVLRHDRKPSDGELKCPTSVMTGRTR